MSVSIIGFDVLVNRVICAYLLTGFTFTQIARFVMPQKGPLWYDYTQKHDWGLYSKVSEPSHFIQQGSMHFLNLLHSEKTEL